MSDGSDPRHANPEGYARKKKERLEATAHAGAATLDRLKKEQEASTKGRVEWWFAVYDRVDSEGRQEKARSYHLVKDIADAAALVPGPHKVQGRVAPVRVFTSDGKTGFRLMEEAITLSAVDRPTLVRAILDQLPLEHRVLLEEHMKNPHRSP